MQIGAFELLKPLGEGGMGTVWQGRHRHQGTDVAIKVTRADVMEDPEYQEAFEQEIRAVAALNHPNIVTILDFGEVPPQASQWGEQDIAAGSPYLVMEYARGGSVIDYFQKLRWPDLRELLLVILDALAHAHARDVIHRDLKPENILVGCGPGWDVKLTDFGLAHAADRFQDDGKVETAWGTPQYMAPEQLRGLWREYGPWTDVYGLGCMAYELICNRWPYNGETLWEIGQAHIEEPIPELHPRFEVPEGTGEWVRKMLGKDRGERFAHAADAAYALAQLPALDDVQKFGVLFDPPDDDPDLSQEPVASQAATQVIPELEVSLSPSTVRYGSHHAACHDPASGALPPGSDNMPPFPSDWRDFREAMISNELIGISLGLFGLRHIPLVDREEERDWMWEHLDRVHDAGRARHLIIDGAAGTGKSQLVKWLGQRAREVGAARVLTAHHSPVRGANDGLLPMMERFLKCARLRGKTRRQHLAKWIVAEGLAGSVDLKALLALFDDRSGADGDPSGRHLSRGERFAIIYRCLASLARHRPLVLWLDDVQWGLEAIGFAQYIAQRQASNPAPILVAMTVRTEAIRDRDMEYSAVAALEDQPDVHRWRLEPLQRADTERLVRHLLRLNEELAQHVLRRSEGVPLFAVQLVGDWVARGKLVMGNQGFELKQGVSIAIPDDLHALWNERIRGFLQGQPEPAAGSLEIAAVLGQEVNGQEWKTAREQAGLDSVSGLAQRLVDDDLVVQTEDGWRFAHGLLRESLERRAREAGRWKRWNQGCANALEQLYDPDEPGVSERLAWYWIDAEKPQRALQPLSRAIDQAIKSSEYDRCAELLKWRESISEPGSEWALKNKIDAARLAARRGSSQQCVAVASSAVDQALDYGFQQLAAQASVWLGIGHRSLGHLDEAEEALNRARQTFCVDDHRGLAPAVLEMGRVEEARGDFELARRHFERARTLFGDGDDRFGEAQAYNAVGDALRRSGEFARAHTACREALKRYRELENLSGIADCLNDLAELSRLQGKMDRAGEFAREALRLYRAVGSGDQHYVRLNLGMILLQKDEFGEAQALFEALIETSEQRGEKSLALKARAGCLAARAGQSMWDGWRAAMQAIEEGLEDTGVAAPVVTRSLAQAATLAEEAGEASLAEQTRQMARRLNSSIRYTMATESDS